MSNSIELLHLIKLQQICTENLAIVPFYSNHKSLVKNYVAIKSMHAAHFVAHTEFLDHTTAMNANDANAMIHAEDINVQMIHVVPLIFDQTMSLAHHLLQFADKVS